MPEAPDTTMTRHAVEFALGLRFDDLPEDVVTIGRRCLIDGLGLFVAGLSERSVQILIADARRQQGRREALLLGAGSTRVPVSLAARVLGTAGHAHDWDDTQVSDDPAHIYGLLTHPTIPPLAAALVIAQKKGAVSGREFLTAFHAGFEVECKVSEWMLPNLYKRAFHSSGVVGIFGACVTAGKLLGLNESQMGNAIGLAASMAAGLRVNFGTMTKPLHVGRAAENGVVASSLAAQGFEADPEALDGQWGYCRAYADGVTEEKVDQGFGKTNWSIVDPGVSIKPYPSGILTHQSMDAMLALVTEHEIQPDDVESVKFYAGSNILNPIRYAVATDHLQAKFSMPALLSMIILNRQAGYKEFRTEYVLSREMQDMQRRIETEVDAEIEAMGTDRIRSRIEITTKDGTQHTKWADERYRGGPAFPLDEEGLLKKFSACTEGYLDSRRRRDVLDAVSTLESSGESGGLARLIQPE